MTTTAVQPITLPSEVAEIREEWIENKRHELMLATDALKDLKVIKAGHSRLTRANDRVRLLKKVVAVMEAGFIPIPRFDSEKLDIDVQALPAKAIAALAVSDAFKLFDEIRFVTGQESDSRNAWPRRGRRNQRDPIIVGVVRTPEHVIENPRTGWRAPLPGLEEHFLIAWWRPEDERDETMF